jgi:hypothetical protein
MTKSFTSTAFQRNPADVFNEVQSKGIATIAHKARPEMIVVLSSDYEASKEKIKQLTEMVKKLDGDAKDQLDMLKG